MVETFNPHWGPRKTPEDIRRAGEVERKLLNPNNVPTWQEAVRSVEIGFQRDVMPMFNKCDHFKGPRGK